MTRTLYLAQREHRAYASEVLALRGLETGRALFGRRFDDAIVAAFMVPAGPRAKQTRVRFSPDSEWQQIHSDFLHSRFTGAYLGDLHSHPGSFDQPSTHDLKTAREIVTSPAWNTPEAVFPIAVIDGDVVRLRAFLMTRETLGFQEIALEIVPDTHPLMMAVLTGTDALKQEVNRASEVPSGRKPRRSVARRIIRRAAAGLWRLSAR